MHSGSPGDADALLADNFVSFADGVRFVNDLNKREYIARHNQLAKARAFDVADVFTAVSENGSAFFLIKGSTRGCPMSMIGRLQINADGQITKLWERRGVLATEAEMLLKDPEAMVGQLSQLPRFRIKPSIADPRRRVNMLVALDMYVQAMNTRSDVEREAHVDAFTLEDFQKWEATGVWRPLSDGVRCVDFACEPHEYKRELVTGRAGFSAAMGSLLTHLGSDPQRGGAVTTMRAKAASETHNIAFLHFNTLGVAAHGPVAFDVQVAFVFTSDGMRMKQAMAFRSAASLQEYSNSFKVPADLRPAWHLP